MSFGDDVRDVSNLETIAACGAIGRAIGDRELDVIADVLTDAIYLAWHAFWAQVAQVVLLEALYDYARPLGYNFATKPALERWLEGLRL